MSNDLPLDDQGNKKEQISQLSPEGLPVETGTIEKEDLFEDLDSPELPKPPTETIPKEKVKGEKPVVKSEPGVKVKNVVDKRTSSKDTTEINDARQPLTRQADDIEEDFIDHVEEVHSII